MDIRTWKNKKLLQGILLCLLLVLSYFIYLPGINGTFIFDDYHNLSPLGKYHQYGFWDNFWLYLLEGHSGPTGRPVSLASFYLDTTQWPAQAKSFIHTNILIHLFNALLLYILSFKLTRFLGLNDTKRLLVSLGVTALWVLNPMQITTVLYIIQRMTELTTTFMLSGIIFYLYGRDFLSKGITNKGLSTLFLGVGISLILAILSKENGILLVAYVLVIEFFLLQPLKVAVPKYFNLWLVPSVVLPFLFIILYLGIRTNPDSFIPRNFTLSERLLTEPRIIFDYLFKITVPNMNDTSLFHDDYVVSRSLFNPVTTIVAIIGIAVLFSFSLLFRKKNPVIAFAIAWFFAGHILESTVLPLELYFEHRNYLPSYGILFAITWFAVKHIDTYKKTIILSSIFLLSAYSFVTFQNAQLWGKPLELSVSWYQAHPKSERAKQFYQSMAFNQGIKATLIPVESKTKSNEKPSMFYTSTIMFDLIRACSRNQLTKSMLDKSLTSITKNRVTVSTANLLKELTKLWHKGNCNSINADEINEYLQALLTIDNVKESKNFRYVIHFLLAEIYAFKKDAVKAQLHLDKSYLIFPTFETLIARANYLTSNGYHQQALDALNDISPLETGLRRKLALGIKQKEIDQVKFTINKEILRHQLLSQ